jgi:hypothetical protein
MNNNYTNKKPWIQKKLEEAEQIDQALTLCKNYKGNNEEVKKWWTEFEKDVLLSKVRGITGNRPFHDTNDNNGGNNDRRTFRAGFGEW